MEGEFDWLSPRPTRELGPALSEAAIEGVTATLHLEEGDEDALWLRVRFDGRELFTPIGLGTVLVVGRARERGPFYLAGSFARRPRRVRRVRVEYGNTRLEASSSDAGWLCLLPAGALGQAGSVTWVDEEGRDHETLDVHPLDDVGVLGPTAYGPPRVRPQRPR